MRSITVDTFEHKVGWVFVCRLTFELTGPWRQGRLAGTQKMYCVPVARPSGLAVAGPVERGVGPQFYRRCIGLALQLRILGPVFLFEHLGGGGFGRGERLVSASVRPPVSPTER